MPTHTPTVSRWVKSRCPAAALSWLLPIASSSAPASTPTTRVRLKYATSTQYANRLRRSTAEARVPRKTAYARLAGAGTSRASIAVRSGWTPERRALLSAATVESAATAQSRVAKPRGTCRRQPRPGRRASATVRDVLLGVDETSLAAGGDARASTGPIVGPSALPRPGRGRPVRCHPYPECLAGREWMGHSFR